MIKHINGLVYGKKYRKHPYFMGKSMVSTAAEVGGIALVLIYGAAFVAALANPLTKRRQEVGR